uniref:Major facilitator superfamily (MFS) profile domain-containing protein n=1 Tax=Stomoxys calcitrans TaxID=35570 RepID=A0A1I8P9Y1_STOCA
METLKESNEHIRNDSNETPNEKLLSHDDILSSNRKLHFFEETITFSEALEKTKYGRFNYLIIMVTGMAWANVLMDTCSVAFYMTVASCDLQLTNYRKSLLSGIGFVGIILSSQLWGFLADTKGRRSVIWPSLVAGFVVTLISSFSNHFWVILVLRLFNGVFVCCSSATVYAYSSEFFTEKTRSKSIMISSFIFSFVGMILPFLAFAIINGEWSLVIPALGLIYKPWRLFVIVCGITGLVCGIIIYFLPESPKFLLSINKEEEAKDVLQKIYRINGGRDELKLPHIILEEDSTDISTPQKNDSSNMQQFFTSMWEQTVTLFRKKYILSTVVVSATQFWLYAIGTGLYMWFPHFINAMGEFMKNNPNEKGYLCDIIHEKDLSLNVKNDNQTTLDCPDKLENITYAYAVLMDILYLLSFAILTFLVNRINKNFIMFIVILFCSGCGLVAIWTANVSISAILYVIFFVVAIGINILGAITVDLYPTQLRGMAMCVSLMIGRLGSVIGTYIVGVLIANNCELTFYIPCCAMMICGFLILLLPRPITVTNQDKT